MKKIKLNYPVGKTREESEYNARLYLQGVKIKERKEDEKYAKMAMAKKMASKINPFAGGPNSTVRPGTKSDVSTGLRGKEAAENLTMKASHVKKTSFNNKEEMMRYLKVQHSKRNKRY